MKYKTLAVAVGSVILFAGCNDSLIFKRLEKTEEWLEAAEAELESTEAKLASMRSEKDQSQADLRKAERSNDSLRAENVALAAYKNKRESADAEARRKYEESARVEKLIGTWKDKNENVTVAISRPRDFYGPLTAGKLSVRVLDDFDDPDSWHQFKVESIAPGHIKLTREFFVDEQHIENDHSPNARWRTIKSHRFRAYHFRLTDQNTCSFWCTVVGSRSTSMPLYTGWPSGSHGEPTQLELEKVSS